MGKADNVTSTVKYIYIYTRLYKTNLPELLYGLISMPCRASIAILHLVTDEFIIYIYFFYGKRDYLKVNFLSQYPIL